MTHGNISIVIVLLSVRYIFCVFLYLNPPITHSHRIAWFLGINRTSYYFLTHKKTA